MSEMRSLEAIQDRVRTEPAIADEWDEEEGLH